MVFGTHSTLSSKIFLAPAVLLSMPGFRIIPGVCAVVSGEAVPLIEILMLSPLFSPVVFSLFWVALMDRYRVEAVRFGQDTGLPRLVQLINSQVILINVQD